MPRERDLTTGAYPNVAIKKLPTAFLLCRHLSGGEPGRHLREAGPAYPGGTYYDFLAAFRSFSSLSDPTHSLA